MGAPGAPPELRPGTGMELISTGSIFYEIEGTGLSRYDNNNNTWVDLASLPLNVDSWAGPAFVNDTTLYVIGAGAVMAYDIATDTWTDPQPGAPADAVRADRPRRLRQPLRRHRPRLRGLGRGHHQVQHPDEHVRGAALHVEPQLRAAHRVG